MLSSGIKKNNKAVTLSRVAIKPAKTGKVVKESRQNVINDHQLFLQLLRNYPDGAISIIDADYNFLYTGGELHSLLHIDPKQLIGKKIYPRFAEPLRQAMLAKLKNVFQNKQSISGFELPFPIAGNTYVMDAFPLFEDNGTVNKTGIIIRNISGLKKIEDNLKKALQKEKELNELKSRFVTMASHEFRTPLSTVLSSAYLLQKYTATDEQPKRDKHLQRIISSVGMLTDILNDFLSVGRIEEGKIQIKPSEFNIRELVTSMSNEFRYIMKKGQDIKYNHTGSQEICTDVSLLKHIIQNLVSNASKFSPEESLVEINTQIKDKRLTLSVKDHGIGISKDDQKHLMERFFRGNNALNIQGTGLGLHIVSRYVELLNGMIKCRSQLGKGTEFIVIINTKCHENNSADRG